MNIPLLLLSIFAAIDIVINAIILIVIADDHWELIPEFFNPITIYRGHHVNYFGCFMWMLFYHTILIPFAIGYWIYMLGKLFIWLCTVGREQDND